MLWLLTVEHAEWCNVVLDNDLPCDCDEPLPATVDRDVD
jgi:hypothetical protein